MKCGICGRKNSRSASYCSSCGSPLPSVFPSSPIKPLESCTADCPHRRPKHLLLLICIGILSITLASTSIFFAVKSYRSSHMPSLIGLSKSDAIQKLEQISFPYELVEVYSSQVEPGHIQEQSPVPGEKLQEGGSAVLTVCIGEGTVVPAVSGKPVQEAKNALEEVSLKIEEEEKSHDIVPKGFIIQTVPAEGSYVEPGSSVRLVVSLGKKVMLPDVTQLSKEDAEQQLAKLGLTCKFEEVYSSKAEAGKLIQPKDEYMYEGDTVVIKISLGEDPRLFAISQVGSSKDSAVTRLKKVGFQKFKTIVEYSDLDLMDFSDGKQEDIVVDQQPKDEKASADQEIVLTVATSSVDVSSRQYSIDFVGGVDVIMNIKNKSDKTIKYIDFYTCFYDNFISPVYCEIRGTNTSNLHFVGPLNSGASTTVTWENVIYNSQMSYYSFDQIVVTFLDGTTQTIYNYF